MNSIGSRAVRISLMLAALMGVGAELLAQTETPQTLAPTPGPDRIALLDTEKELHAQVVEAWRRGQGELVRQHLVQLLSLRLQLYPVESYPSGHANLLNCLLDLARVCRDLNRTEDVVKYGQQAREMANRLYPKEDFPNGHPHLAAAMMAEASGCALRGDSRQARLGYLAAAKQMGAYRKFDRNVTAGSIEADAYNSLAFMYERENQYRLAATIYKKAREAFESYDARGVGYADCLLAGARVLRRLGHYDESFEFSGRALSAYRDLLQESHNPDGHPMIVRALWEHGLVLFRFGRDAEARTYLLEARAMDHRLSDRSARVPEQRSHILNGLLLVSISECRMADADRYARELEASLERLYSTNQYPHGHPILASVLTNLGSYYHLAGDLESGQRYYRRSFAMWKDLDDAGTHPGHVTILDAMGRLHLDLGQYARAYGYQSSALAMARDVFPKERYPRGHEILSRCLQNMAALYWFMGETEKSAACYREAVEQNEQLFPEDRYPNRHPILQQSYAAWGCVLLHEGRLDEAEQILRKSYQTARDFYDSSRYPRGHKLLNKALFDLGTLESTRGRYEQAQQCFEQVLSSIRQLHDGQLPAAHHDVADTLAQLGRARLAQGQFSEAIRDFEDAQTHRQTLLPPELCPLGHPRLFRSLIDLGKAHASAGNFDEALGFFSEAAEMEYDLVASFCSSCSEAELLNYVHRKLQAVDHLLSVPKTSDARSTDVYQHVWRRHALVQRLVRQRQVLLRRAAVTKDLEAYEEYLASRRTLAQALLVSLSDDAQGSHRELERLRHLNARKEQLERQLTSSATVSDVHPHQIEGYDQLIRALPHGAAFIDLLKYEGEPDRAKRKNGDEHPGFRYAAFILMPNRDVQFVELGKADTIDPLIRPWLANMAESRVDGLGQQLSERLWRPIAQVLPSQVSTVYFCPDAELIAVPWAALPDQDGGPLVRRRATAVVPSGPVLLQQLRQEESKQQPKSSQRVLAIGDVDYGEVNPQSLHASAGMQRLEWESLPGTAAELEQLKKACSGREVVVLRGNQATVQRVLNELPKSRWAHIATHGFFVDPKLSDKLRLAAGHTFLPQLTVNATRESVLSRNPFILSGLVLAHANSSVRSESPGPWQVAPSLLTAESIATVDCTNLELVVLSACDTARGDQQPGDGVFGLQCAFHVAGTRNVIASLWKIDDLAAQQLMKAFYQHLWQDNMSPLQALRHAQLDMMDLGGYPAVPRGPRLSTTVGTPEVSELTNYHAVHWAGFVLSGCGQ